MKKNFLIGEMARQVGCDVQTIRYYEKISILPKPSRTAGNQRLYSEEHLKKLEFIRHCRALGYGLEQIRRLLELECNMDQTCEEITLITEQCLQDVQEKIARLQGLQIELENILSKCSGGTVSTCQIIQSLSDHNLCTIRNHEIGKPKEVGV